MESIKKETLSHMVSDRMKQFIEEQQLNPGDKLPSEKELIQRFSVSRTVIREALKSLEIIEIIEIKPGDGIYVKDQSLRNITGHISSQLKRNKEKMNDLLEVRRYLELNAIEMTILRSDEQLLKRLEFWIDQMEMKISMGEPPIEEDLQFHRSLFLATGNKIFAELSEFLYEFFHDIRKERFELLGNSRISLQEHKEIYQCMLNKDITGAKTGMLKHLQVLDQYV
ncbi:FadR family transcriptional regulator [Paenibacillus mesophilus]|uniref:FadR/GntR family transcriptional regulator n=1 Tax=Paenibacillus mesophilus TaxID=2582849 RepID=UPI00110D658E|nr:FadR/GntR family transcriptional regulator [Paenibacillus mesophilus]TMV48757.1 FadR family transcriptional regulator [Paenibacillus mesophilus]